MRRPGIEAVRTLFLIIAGLSAFSASANAENGCAADTMTVLANQAVLQTGREMVYNQAYILKPDSVLDYSCFNQFLQITADQAGPIFSETTYWQGRRVDLLGKTVTVNQGLGGDSLDLALAAVVTSAVQSYKGANFSSDYLGGKVARADGGSMCDAMSRVWQSAKCKNTDAPATFYTFKEMISTDPRDNPGHPSCSNTGTTQVQIDKAGNKDAQVAAYSKPKALKPLISGDSCALTVYTNVTVRRKEGSARISEEVTYDDATCVNTGCSYLGMDGRGCTHSPPSADD